MMQMRLSRRQVLLLAELVADKTEAARHMTEYFADLARRHDFTGPVVLDRIVFHESQRMELEELLRLLTTETRRLTDETPDDIAAGNNRGAR